MSTEKIMQRQKMIFAKALAFYKLQGLILAVGFKVKFPSR